MLNVFFIFSSAKKDGDDFKKYRASKNVEEKERMYNKFDVHTLYFVDGGFTFANPPSYQRGHKAVTKVVTKVPIMERFLGKAGTSAQQDNSESDSDPDDPPQKDSPQDDDNAEDDDSQSDSNPDDPPHNDEDDDRVSDVDQDSDDSQKLRIDTQQDESSVPLVQPEPEKVPDVPVLDWQMIHKLLVHLQPVLLVQLVQLLVHLESVLRLQLAKDLHLLLLQETKVLQLVIHVHADLG